MAQIIIGIAFIIFGLTIGGVGIASAGVGIGIPMIPFGIYIILRGYRALNNDKRGDFDFEKTPIGKIALGILLIIIAIGTGGSAILVYALFGAGAYFFYNGLKSKK